ncbi:MAG: FAD-dependent thymidylate synthase [Deltaproteobacteria bacterium]|nr:FAD-dependent thymidylate synthase [Candidatus Zymogenaceae bacterium]
MRVILSGMNIDIERLADYRRRAASVRAGLSAGPAKVPDEVITFLDDFSQSQDLTPETLSAGYARISRDPRPVDEVRRDAAKEIQRARRSNKAIIFGMGHSSIAEHAVFNLDIIGISRLATEELQRTRLASYTEKSQRYITLTGDYLVPEEIAAMGLSGRLAEVVSFLNTTYTSLNEGLTVLMEKKYPELWSDPRGRGVAESYAKEDARYVMPLAALSQMGMTANSRVIEMTIRRLAAHPLAEVRELSARIFDAALPHAPSVMRHTDPTPYDTQTPAEIADIAEQLARDAGGTGDDAIPLRLVDYTPDADDRLAAALLFGRGNRDFDSFKRTAKSLTGKQKELLIGTAFSHIESYDRVLREFELITLTYEAVVSASNFAQLKRHRMATIIAQDYDTGLGVQIPPSIEEAGLTGTFREAIGRAQTLFEEVRKKNPRAAPYILTNAHKRRVLIAVNLRELYHIARLRMDKTAQWDIRNLAAAMAEAARGVMPLATRLLAGKDAFNEVRNRSGIAPA